MLVPSHLQDSSRVDWREEPLPLPYQHLQEHRRMR